MFSRRLIPTLLLLLPLVTAGAAEPPTLEELQAEEERLQLLFRDGMADVVADLNAGSFYKLSQAIDNEDMLERIFGLRLIDARIKRDFRDDMRERNNFEQFIGNSYQMESEDGMRATLLVVESRGDRGRAVVRFDMSHFRVNYIEYELGASGGERLQVVDWLDYGWGHRFTDRVGLMLVQAQPNKNAARKLVDFANVREADVFQVMEVLKASRDFNFDRYFTIYDAMDDRLKRQRPILVAGLDATRMARKRREQRRILIEVDRYYPDDALFALSLLDYYFPDRQYQKAYEALMRVKNKLRIDDAVSNARLSSATLVLDRVEDANAHADAAIRSEPGLELGWWAALRARVAQERYEDAVAALATLRQDFGHALDPETMARDPLLAKFAQSGPYREWLAGNPPPAAEVTDGEG